MPMVRKLDADEVQDIENKGKGQRKLTEELYDRYLADFAEGEWGEATLDANENRLTVRNRFKAAAKRRGVGLEFRRTRNDLLRFRIVAGNGHLARARVPVVATPPEPAPAPAKKRGGRPKKNA